MILKLRTRGSSIKPLVNQLDGIWICPLDITMPVLVSMTRALMTSWSSEFMMVPATTLVTP